MGFVGFSSWQIDAKERRVDEQRDGFCPDRKPDNWPGGVLGRFRNSFRVLKRLLLFKKIYHKIEYIFFLVF